MRQDTRHATRSVLLSAILVLSLVAGGITFATPTAAASHATISASPAYAGNQSTHRVAIGVSSNEAGNSLSNIEVNYHADGTFDGSVQDVSVDDVVKVDIDEDGDGEIETSTMSQFTVKNERPDDARITDKKIKSEQKFMRLTQVGDENSDG